MRLVHLIFAAALSLLLSGCGFNDFQKLDEQTRSAWSEVLNQFQRRAMSCQTHRKYSDPRPMAS